MTCSKMFLLVNLLCVRYVAITPEIQTNFLFVLYLSFKLAIVQLTAVWRVNFG